MPVHLPPIQLKRRRPDILELLRQGLNPRPQARFFWRFESSSVLTFNLTGQWLGPITMLFYTLLMKRASEGHCLALLNFHSVQFIRSVFSFHLSFTPKPARKNVAYLPHVYFSTGSCKSVVYQWSYYGKYYMTYASISVTLWTLNTLTRMPHEVVSLQFPPPRL